MFRYQSIVNVVQESVASGALKPGERLPSVRQMSQRMGCSAVTVHHAYLRLESDGILEARPRSGFYVSETARALPEFSKAAMDFHPQDEAGSPTSAAFLGLLASWQEARIRSFGDLAISDDLLPYRELYGHLLENLRQDRLGRSNMPWEGVESLRDVLAKRHLARGLNVDARSFIVTRGVEHALALSLDLVTKPGDKILVESPSSASCISTVLQKNLELIEIYSHPKTGIDPDQFRDLLEKNHFAACVLTTTNHSPTGVSYSHDTIARISEAAAQRNVLIIEYDEAGELSHAASVGPSYKQFDSRDLVLQVGGLAGTLGPRFGIGWLLLSRRFKSRLLRQYMPTEPLAADSALQEAVADFMSRRSYDRHLRQLREQLVARTSRGLSLISQKFPPHCAVSRPTGGYVCWVRGPKGFDSLAAARQFVKHGVSFAPGPMFSVTRAFGNFFALNLSGAWDSRQEEQISMIGSVLRGA
jgi:DNA-binding transcriptional MocR family regulator